MMQLLLSKRQCFCSKSSSGRRWDIQNAVKRILSSKKNNVLKNFNEKDFEKYLSTSNIPDPELLIRTSGEQRISNFYLWQTAYTELYFTDILWPDFNKNKLDLAINDYNSRSRRFGNVINEFK